MQEMCKDQMQSNSLKQLLPVLILTPTAKVMMETGIWPTKDYLQYNDALSQYN